MLHHITKYYLYPLYFILSFITFTYLPSYAQNNIPVVVKGKIVRLENFKSKYVTDRNIDIWLPQDYSDTSKYAVLYMHDGQMLYDAAITWNKQAWDIDDVASEMFTQNKIKKFIVVGIWNGGATRHRDYFPEKPFRQLRKSEKDTITAQLIRAGRTKENFIPNSDNYLKFIVKELKPYIDNHFSVLRDRNNTMIAGSSMGGLISVYAICQYPNIFGGAACLSTHWTGTFTSDNNPFPHKIILYLTKKLPDSGNHKIYFDCGDQSLDQLYPPIQQRIDSVMVAKGYNYQQWVTKYFPGENHSENAWKKRLHIPIEFLMKYKDIQH